MTAAAHDHDHLATATYTRDLHVGCRVTLTLSARRDGANADISYDTLYWSGSRKPDEAAYVAWINECIALFMDQVRSRILQ